MQMDAEKLRQYAARTAEASLLCEDILSEHECSPYEVRCVGMRLIENAVKRAIQDGWPLETVKIMIEGIEGEMCDRVFEDLEKKK